MVARLRGGRMTVDLPTGWEGVIDEGGPRPDGATRRTVVHLANFPLPAERADYGGGAVDHMRPGDALVILLEFGPESIGQPLFSADGPPRSLASADFARDRLQRQFEGQGGAQIFFTASGRPFCLYVVVGSHIDRADVLPAINRILTGLQIER